MQAWTQAIPNIFWARTCANERLVSIRAFEFLNRDSRRPGIQSQKLGTVANGPRQRKKIISSKPCTLNLCVLLLSTLRTQKVKLRHHGQNIGADEPLTNVRYGLDLSFQVEACGDLVTSLLWNWQVWVCNQTEVEMSWPCLPGGSPFGRKWRVKPLHKILYSHLGSLQSGEKCLRAQNAGPAAYKS